ncbi:HPP family protein [Mariprofundus ferrooxydans]|nr:HPP family protein [Mariprofundus ferrooxydans]
MALFKFTLLYAHLMHFIATLKEAFLNSILPRQSQYEVFVSSLGAIIGIALVAWGSHFFVGSAGLPFVVASMGAAAVLLYAAPHSPLTHPWAFVGGHLISATVGVTCAQWVPDLFLASGLAVGLAIFAMHQLRCLHPPGGAAALVAVVGGEQIHALGYLYVLIPVALNVAILGLAVALTRSLIARHKKKEPYIFYHDIHEDTDIPNKALFSRDDLNSALHEMHTYIDVSIEDLNQIYAHANIFAHKRQLGAMICSEMMRIHLVSVEFGDYLDTTWALMQRHGLKGMPVINRARRVIGIITITDFKKEAAKYAGETTEKRLKEMTRRTGELSSSKPEVVGQLMTSSVITLSEDTPVTEAVSIFAENNIDHIPIINDEQRLSGILLRSDIHILPD